VKKEGTMKTHFKITLLTLILAVGSAFAADYWSGYVDIKTTYVLGDGQVLEIAPGTVVRFAYDTKLIVDGGILLARGEKDNMIRFTSYLPEFSENDFWEGIDFYNANMDTSRIEYCVIENIVRKDGRGAIFSSSSMLSIKHSRIHNNYGDRGGAVFADETALQLSHNTIENNTARYFGGAVFISNSAEKYAQSFIYKNLIFNNKVEDVPSGFYGGGGIFVFEQDPVTSSVIIQENDIIANVVNNRESGLGGFGGGVLIATRAKYSVEFTGNKVMYNKSGTGGGLSVLHNTYKSIPPHKFTNNIISNNTAADLSGGIYYNTVDLTNPSAIIFENNNIVNNLNTNTKTGTGGLWIEFNDQIGNFFPVINSIIWDNYRGAELKDIGTNPYLYPGNFVSYSNSTSMIEGGTNISSNSLFQRTVTYKGADPYENYLRGDYHLSLESPCIDKGDPKSGVEWDGTTVNIGAYGNTNEAATSVYQTIIYTKPINVNVKRGETFKLDCRNYKDTVILNDLIIEDGGQIYLAANNTSPVIEMNSLITYGTKIGERYTTRLHRMATAQSNEFSYNILNIKNIDVTGAEFNNMSVNVNSSNYSRILDSRIYIYDYNQNLNGVTISTPEGDVIGNTIDNFGIGVYFNGAGKGKASKGRISNNTIRFDADAVNKGETKAKGVKVENATDANVENNNVVNPNEGVEVSTSSGRISNNTVRFDADAVNKGVALKRGIYVFGGAVYEAEKNKIICNDTVTPAVRAFDVSDSFIDASYNIIDFGPASYGKNTRHGFYTYNLSKYSIFINNTVFNSSHGIENLNAAYSVRLYNTIFFGPVSTYITGNAKRLVLYNNDIVGEINYNAVAEEKNTISDNPLFQSSKVNDFYLWNESKCINAGYFMPEYHTYGTTFYGTAPDIGAVEFYQESSFYAPQNLTSSVSGTTLTLNWSAVPDAVSYNIFGSPDPYGTFAFLKDTPNTYWSASTSSGTKYFYYVTAVRDGVKSDINEEADPTAKIKSVDSKKKLIKNDREELK
jgi:parallel beta-helix repeat protein